MFHVSLVKPYRMDGSFQPLPIEQLPDWQPTDPDGLFPIERVLDYRRRKIGKRRWVEEFLVKWRGYAEEHNSWEPAAHFTPDMSTELDAVRARSRGDAPS